MIKENFFDQPITLEDITKLQKNLNSAIQQVSQSMNREQIIEFDLYLELHFYLRDIPDLFNTIFDEKIVSQLYDLEKQIGASKIKGSKLGTIIKNIRSSDILTEKNFSDLALISLQNQIKLSNFIGEFIVIYLKFYIVSILLEPQLQLSSNFQQSLNNLDQFTKLVNLIQQLLQLSIKNTNEEDITTTLHMIMAFSKIKPMTIAILSKNVQFPSIVISLINNSESLVQIMSLVNAGINYTDFDISEKLEILKSIANVLPLQKTATLINCLYQVKLWLQNDESLILEYIMIENVKPDSTQQIILREIFYGLSQPSSEIGLQQLLSLLERLENPNLKENEIKLILAFLFISIQKLTRSQQQCLRFVLSNRMWENNNDFVTYMINLLDYFFRIDLNEEEVKKLLQSKSNPSQIITNNLSNSSRQHSTTRLNAKLSRSSSYSQVILHNPNLQLALSNGPDEFQVNLQQSISILENNCLMPEIDIEKSVKLNDKVLGIYSLFPFEETLFTYCYEIFQNLNLKMLLSICLDQSPICDEYQISILAILSFYKYLFQECHLAKLTRILQGVLMCQIDALIETKCLIIIKNLQITNQVLMGLISVMLQHQLCETNQILILQILLNQQEFQPSEQIIYQNYTTLLPAALNLIEQENIVSIILIKFQLMLSLIYKFKYQFYSRQDFEKILRTFRWNNIELEQSLFMIKFFSFVQQNNKSSFSHVASNYIIQLLKNVVKQILSQQEILISTRHYTNLKIMILTFANLLITKSSTTRNMFELFLSLFETFSELNFSQKIQVKQFELFLLQPALNTIIDNARSKYISMFIERIIKSILKLLCKEKELGFSEYGLQQQFQVLEILTDNNECCELINDSYYALFENCSNVIIQRSQQEDLKILYDRIQVKLQLQKPTQFNYAAILENSVEESKYYSVLKDESPLQDELRANQYLNNSKQVYENQHEKNNLKKQFETLKALSQQKLKYEQLKYTFWIVEQNIINVQTALYSHQIGLSSLLIKYSQLCGSLYCLSKILAFSLQYQDEINTLNWQSLNLDKLTEENLEFLIQNRNLKVLQQHLLGSDKITKLIDFSSDLSVKIIKKSFFCLNSFCRNHIIAEQFFTLRVIEKILKNVQIAKQECILLIGSICLSQNAQAEIMNTDLQDTILNCLDTKEVQLLANSFYALSGICFNQSFIQLKYITSQIILSSIGSNLLETTDSIVVEAISQLISNLTYNNNQAKSTLSKFIPNFIDVSLKFVNSIHNNEQYTILAKIKTLKSLLRALNNLIYLSSNCMYSIENNILQLCQAIYSNDVFCNEYFDVLINLGIHQQLTQSELLYLDRLIQENKLPQYVLKILDAINSSSKQYCNLICQECKLEIYQSFLISHSNQQQIVLRIYRLISNLLFNSQNYLYLEQCNFISQIKCSSSNKEIQYYFDKIQQQIFQARQNATLIGNISNQQKIFQVQVVKGNLTLQQALLIVTNEKIAISQNGISKQKYIIQQLKESIVNIDAQLQEFKYLLKIHSLIIDLCICLIGKNNLQNNKIIFQVGNLEEKQQIIRCIECQYLKRYQKSSTYN